jgi:hypothetical protein
MEHKVRTSDVDSGILALGTVAGAAGVRLSESWKSPVFGGAPYLQIWRRLEHLASRGQVRIDKDGSSIIYFIKEQESVQLFGHKHHKAVGAALERENPAHEASRSSR